MSKVEPSAFVLKCRPWSVSKADVAGQCPYKFYLTYVKKRKPVVRNGVEALVGQAAHKALEYALSGQSMDRSFQFAVDELELVSTEIERLAVLRPSMVNFITRFNTWKARYAVKTVVLERKMGAYADGRSADFFNNDAMLRGVVDLTVFMPDGKTAVVLDHKSGKPHDLTHYASQFLFYVLMIKAHHPKLTQIQTGINHLQSDSLDFGKMYPVDDTSALWDQVITHLNAVTKETESEQPRKGWWCGWCDHKDCCPSHQESVNVEERPESSPSLTGHDRSGLDGGACQTVAGLPKTP